MAISDITKPMALDETLQGTNTKMDAVILKLQGIIDALGLDTSVYKPKGNIACAQLVPALLIESNIGNVYNVTDNGTTTSDFAEGAGKPIHVGDNVAIVDVGTGGQSEYKFDLLAGMVDLTNYVQKSQTAGLLKNDGTVDETPYTVTESSTTNGNIVIDDVETPVYRNYANNTVLTTDKSPYLNRQCLTPTGFSSYVREKLIGVSVAWNNLCNSSSVTVPSGHKYLLKKSGVLSLGESTGSAITGLTSGTDVVTDLTLAFGSTVADTLYAMTNNGGIDWLRNHNYPIDQYTQYGYGLYSSKPSAKVVGSANLFDEEYSNISSTIQYRSIYLGVGTYTMSSNAPTSTGCMLFFLDGQVTSGANNEINGVGNNLPRTLTTSSGYITVAYRTTGDGSPVNYHTQIERGSTPTTYEKSWHTTYSLGNTELRGHLIVQNGEIVAEGDVRESNGNVTRKYKLQNMGDLSWQYSDGRFNAQYPGSALTDAGGEIYGGYYYKNVMCAKYVNASTTTDKTFFLYTSNKILYVYDSAYTDAATFKTAMSGVYLIYELATPTTETSSPFADPMSLNGCTTEEYVDDRTIPVPVGHETQYMGQSEDVVPIPSMPQSDGVWVQKCYVSGGKAQYVWELET